MSNPSNPLDRYTTYTYHFELWAAANFDDLALVQSTSSNVPTEPHKAAHIDGTNQALLLINTRKDAHQTIDDVDFGYIGPSGNPHGQFSPDGSMTFKVIEPNRIYFVEKLANVLKTLNASDLSSLHWGLRVYFVGRTPENKIEELPAPGQHGILIPMAFADMNAEFTNAGGVYNFNFVSLSTFAGSENPVAKSNILLAGHCNQSLSIASSTVEDALKVLEAALNDNYEQTYQTILANNKNARPIKYFININDPDIKGEISLVGADLFEGGQVKMTFSPEKTILEWIYTILRSSTSLNALVASSLDNNGINGLKSPGHPGVKIISVYPSFVGYEKECHIIYDIYMYTGADDITEFDFMFANPGSAVDVISFGIKMKTALAWFANNTAASTINLSGNNQQTVQTIFANQTISSNPKQNTTEGAYVIPGYGNDPAYLPISISQPENSLIRYKTEKDAQVAKLMFNTVTQMNGAFDAMFSFDIRGNLNFLTAGIIFPRTLAGAAQEVPFGVKNPKWIKVNVRSPNDSRDKNASNKSKNEKHESMFYNGLYQVISIRNKFTAGHFTQELSVMMMAPLSQSTDSKSGTKEAPVKATPQIFTGKDKNYTDVNGVVHSNRINAAPKPILTDLHLSENPRFASTPQNKDQNFIDRQNNK